MNQVQKFITSNQRVIYAFPVRTFEALINNIYVVDDGENLILVDCGSGAPQSNADLAAGMTAVGEAMGRPLSLSDISHILITHGHIDHFGGLAFVRQTCQAPVGIHILDRRVLTAVEERLIFASRRLESFLEGAGISAQSRQGLMDIYKAPKNVYKSQSVQFLLEEGVPTVGGLEVYHVPGHCPGQVCLRVDDVLLTADHILARITPHQAPESITHTMGLDHYLDSLVKMSKVSGIRLGLGGHEEPIADIYSRIASIRQSHDERLNKILELCQTPQTIADVSRALFKRQKHYHILLALEETGAHVEYLHQRGELMAANIEEIEQTSHPVVQYQRA